MVDPYMKGVLAFVFLIFFIGLEVGAITAIARIAGAAAALVALNDGEVSQTCDQHGGDETNNEVVGHGMG